jgi:hypothetical protein
MTDEKVSAIGRRIGVVFLTGHFATSISTSPAFLNMNAGAPGRGSLISDSFCASWTSKRNIVIDIPPLLRAWEASPNSSMASPARRPYAVLSEGASL